MAHTGFRRGAVLHDRHEPGPCRCRADPALESHWLRSSQHQLRRREHLGQGGDGGSCLRQRRGADVGQRIRGGSRHAVGRRAVGPGRRSAPRPQGGVPGRGAGGRAARDARLLPLRPGRGRSQHRHLDARAAPGPARRSSPPRRHHRAGRRRRRRRADQAVLRGGGRLGAVAATRVRARAADRAHPRVPPRPQGRGPGRPRPDHVGPDLAGVRAQLPGPDPPGGGVHPQPGQAGAAGRPPPRVRAPART